MTPRKCFQEKFTRRITNWHRTVVIFFHQEGDKKQKEEKKRKKTHLYTL